MAVGIEAIFEDYNFAKLGKLHTILKQLGYRLV